MIGSNNAAGKASTTSTIGTLTRQKLVNESKVEYATWGVNHVQGCLHDCKYCYARTEGKVHGRIACDAEWTKIALVENAAAQVGGQLDRMRTKVDRIHLCFTTDPFMWDAGAGALVPEVVESTLAIIRAVNERGIPVTTLTKGVYPELDLRSLHPDNQYGITVVSLDEDYRREWEPGSAPASMRIRSLENLAEAGARTWVSMEPYPTPNIDPYGSGVLDTLEALAFIDKFIFGRMNYVTEATEYLREDPTYYDQASAEFIEWCQVHGKAYHVKKKTPGYSPATTAIMHPLVVGATAIEAKVAGEGVAAGTCVDLALLEWRRPEIERDDVA